VDRGILAAIAVGMATLAGSLPYIKASGEFKKHYYVSKISNHMLTQPYRQMLLDYTAYPKMVQTVLVVVILLAGAAVVWGCLRAVLRSVAAASVSEWTLILLLVLMPFFAFVLGRLVTHALEVRHSIGAIVGISMLIAVAAASMLRRSSVFYGVMAAMLVGIVLVNGVRTHESIVAAREDMAKLTLNPAQ